jgi:hypothetical protein
MSAEAAPGVPRSLRALMLLTDLGFVVYWLLTALHAIPPQYAYSDYRDPVIVAWNWSFLPLDLLVSATGLSGLWWSRRAETARRGEALVLASLAFTVASGLQALSFWAVRGELDVTWWVLNGFLVGYPLPFLARRVVGGVG